MKGASALRWAVCLALCACEKPATEATQTDWREVRRQFVANQDRANKDFKGVRVEWTGTASSTGLHMSMNDGLFAVLYPEAGNKSTAFVAWFASDMKDEVFALRPGQPVTVSCRIDHISTKFSEVAIALDECRLVSVKPMPSGTTNEVPLPPERIFLPDERRP